MTNNFEKLLKFFPSGTAEGEREILDKVFIYADEFSQIISPIPGNPVLLIGDKGSGKSALIDFSSRLVLSQKSPCVTLTPFDIDTSGISTEASTGDMVRLFYDILLISIAKKLSEENTGWLEKNYATLYYAAVDAGARTSDFPGKIGKLISEIAKPIIKVDLASAFPNLTKTTREDVERAAQKIIGTKSFYLFIDDTDQISSPDGKSHLNRVWSLLLAIRRLAEKIPELKAVVTLRSEVWNRLQRDESGQRDQTDHFKTLVTRIISNRDHVRNILQRRLSLASTDLTNVSDLFRNFFEGDGATAPHSTDFRSWQDLIVIRSRERPRDAIQLINSLAKKAIQKRKDKIDQVVFHEVMPEFSRYISEQFAQEVSKECPESLEILKSFADVEYDHPGFTLSAQAARSHFLMLSSKFGIHLYGFTIRGGNEADAFDLWRFFYICNVINARVSDSTARDGFRHLAAEEDLSLVSKIRWNDLQKVLWEINTAYRDYLIQIQGEKAIQIGLPVKRKKPQRK